MGAMGPRPNHRLALDRRPRPLEPPPGAQVTADDESERARTPRQNLTVAPEPPAHDGRHALAVPDTIRRPPGYQREGERITRSPVGHRPFIEPPDHHAEISDIRVRQSRASASGTAGTPARIGCGPRASADPPGRSKVATGWIV